MAERKIAFLPENKGRPFQPAVRNVVKSSVLPKSGTEFVLYAVELKEHPGVTKVGRTTRWRNRRKSYADWNLASGDAIGRERVFRITDEFVDLELVERAMLEHLDYPRRHGFEWLAADFDEVCREVDRFLCDNEISYI